MERNIAIAVPNEEDHKNHILDLVASSNGFFKSQQIGEKDLTFDEKRKIAESLLESNVPLFLQRYWKFVDFKDLGYFEPYKHDYQVNFYMSEIVKFQDSKIRSVKVKNRRYEALRGLINEGSYFSEVEMRKRNPLLYEQLIGQYLSDKEREIISLREASHVDSFSSFLMTCFEKSQENQLRARQEAAEDHFVEEEDDDDDKAESEEEYESDGGSSRPLPSDSEKEMLRNEFKNIMYETFLAGKDSDFDYSNVDDNAEYDSVDQRGIDEEEKYFDEESSGAADDAMECDVADCL